ncbi:MAG TPA: GH92 family glycosyl hydrolase [Acidimicrobiales bacterium]|nr:GH92 family glycosyl hydrolase [Acidimicrobiales bacterium]
MAEAAAVAALGSLVLVGVGGVAPAGATSILVSDPASLVNPFVGTAHGGDTFPGADVPFGMIQWSPDTVNRPNGGGYGYHSSSIIGYSLTHLSGAGCPAEGDVPILPTVGAVGTDPSATTEPLVHGDEVATPGYYQLDAGGVDTQLTTTTRSGMATFTFPSTGSTGNLLFKLSDSATYVEASQFDIVGDKEVEGSVTTGGFCGASNTYTLHFDMVFNRAFVSSGAWSSGAVGDYVSFDVSSNPVVEAKVGISYVSDADAVGNRVAENPGWNFDSVKAAALSSWQDILSRVQVAGGTAGDRSVFYTALYHSLLAPNVFSDVNGQYMGPDGQVHHVKTPQRAQYANYSGWDIYRSEVQLEALLAPQQTSDIVTSMLNDDAQIGQLPKWAENDGEAYLMVGDPADSIIADAYAFGATNFDTATALKDMTIEATTPNNVRPGLSDDETDGYLPIDATYGCCNFYGPVSTQEEYDAADNSIAQFATAIGDSDVAQTFGTRAQNWQNVFNPDTGFMQPKEESGQFQPGFDPTSETGFVEADSYVYTAMVPFDVAGVIAAAGGDTAWIAYLDGLTSSVTANGPGQIQMGNEPSFDIPWEYDYAGAPAKTEEVVRQIEEQLFTDSPQGLAGNDDLGAMSSWYVWAALGAYPEMPGSAVVALGSPLFRAIVIHLINGRTITETSPSAADDAPYVQSMTLDAMSWPAAYLPAHIFTNGGTLEWALGVTPGTWGTGADDLPPSAARGLLPALGYLAGVDGGSVRVSPGGSADITLGVQSMSTSSQQMNWTASATSGSGIVIGPTTGTVTVPTEAKGTQPVAIQVPPGTAEGRYLVVFGLRSTTGVALPDVVAEIDVT